MSQLQHHHRSKPSMVVFHQNVGLEPELSCERPVHRKMMNCLLAFVLTCNHIGTHLVENVAARECARPFDSSSNWTGPELEGPGQKFDLRALFRTTFQAYTFLLA